MKVYLVMGGVYYEGECVLSAHVTKESAEEEKRTRMGESCSWDYINVDDYELVGG